MNEEGIQEIINYENYRTDLTLLNEFSLLSEDNVKSIITSMSSKYCELDNLSVPLLKIVLKFLYQL